MIVITATMDPAYSTIVNSNTITFNLNIKHWCWKVVIDQHGGNSDFPFKAATYVKSSNF